MKLTLFMLSPWGYIFCMLLSHFCVKYLFFKHQSVYFLCGCVKQVWNSRICSYLLFCALTSDWCLCVYVFIIVMFLKSTSFYGRYSHLWDKWLSSFWCIGHQKTIDNFWYRWNSRYGCTCFHVRTTGESKYTSGSSVWDSPGKFWK